MDGFCAAHPRFVLKCPVQLSRPGRDNAAQIRGLLRPSQPSRAQVRERLQGDVAHTQCHTGAPQAVVDAHHVAARARSQARSRQVELDLERPHQVVIRGDEEVEAGSTEVTGHGNPRTIDFQVQLNRGARSVSTLGSHEAQSRVPKALTGRDRRPIPGGNDVPDGLDGPKRCV